MTWAQGVLGIAAALVVSQCRQATAPGAEAGSAAGGAATAAGPSIEADFIVDAEAVLRAPTAERLATLEPVLREKGRLWDEATPEPACCDWRVRFSDANRADQARRVAQEATPDLEFQGLEAVLAARLKEDAAKTLLDGARNEGLAAYRAALTAAGAAHIAEDVLEPTRVRLTFAGTPGDVARYKQVLENVQKTPAAGRLRVQRVQPAPVL